MSLKPLLSHVKKLTTAKIKTLHKIRKYLDNFSALAIDDIGPLRLQCFSSVTCLKSDREDLQIIQNNALRLRLGLRISLVDIHSRANLISLDQRCCMQLLSLLFVHGHTQWSILKLLFSKKKKKNENLLYTGAQ